MKLTQPQFGKRAGVSKQAVSHWENGLAKPDHESLRNLEKNSYINPDYITDGTGEIFKYLQGSPESFALKNPVKDSAQLENMNTADWLCRRWLDLPLSARKCIWEICRSHVGETIERRFEVKYVKDDKRST